MNKQLITDLVKQATVEVPHERQWDAMSSVFDKHKFAELIVKECGILADMYQREVKLGTINSLNTTCYEFITKHFGIE